MKVCATGCCLSTLLLVAIVGFSEFGCAGLPVGTVPGGRFDGTVRIGVAEAVSELTLTGARSLRIVAGPSTLHGRTFRVAVAGDEVRVTGDGCDVRARSIAVQSDGPIGVGEVRYRGAVDVFVRGGALTAVNVIPIEEYLRGVVPAEIGYLPVGDIEAVKAQALAARTYTISHIGRRVSRGFDLYGDVRDQVYGGVGAESDLGSRAVAETRGQVITHNGRLIRAYFHSTCGGSTANIEDVWDSPPVPYLKRVYDAENDSFFCEASPHFRWHEVYARGRAHEIVGAHIREGVPDATGVIGRLREVVVAAQALSGRARYTRIVSDTGSWEVPKDRIRSVLRRPGDEALLRSSYVRMFTDRTPDGHLSRLVVSGAGNGHGVGMCQWGAIGMARRGSTAEQIVKHYYRGVEVTGLESAQVALVEGAREVSR